MTLVLNVFGVVIVFVLPIERNRKRIVDEKRENILKTETRTLKRMEANEGKQRSNRLASQ